MAAVSDIESKEGFEDLCMDIALNLKRDKKEALEKCVISKMIDYMNLTIQEKHELYAIYHKIRMR